MTLSAGRSDVRAEAKRDLRACHDVAFPQAGACYDENLDGVKK